jgi:nitroreductase
MHNKHNKIMMKSQKQSRMHYSFLLVWISILTTRALVLPPGTAKQNPAKFSPLFSQNDEATNNNNNPDVASINNPSALADIIKNRYACTRFQRFDGVNETTTLASPSHPTTVQEAFDALELARRAPSGFNVQPYKLLLVHSPEQKAALAKYCIGHNAHRVRDSDCTAVFLADRECLRELKPYRQLLFQQNPNWKTKPFGLFKIQLFVGLFSSGLPFPKVLSGPISWAVRFGMRVVSWILRGRMPVPTLSSADTWSQKNTMLVGMTYLLACTSKNIATCPMEGYLAWGVRQALHIPRRYSIPLIVSTGRPYVRPTSGTDDAGMTHGNSKETATPRFSSDQVIFGDSFGKAMA